MGRLSRSASLIALAAGVGMAIPCAATANQTFLDALTAAYETNPQILAERERQKSTDEAVSQAISGFRPEIAATYEEGRQRTALDGASESYGDVTNKSLRIEQPLFRGGRTMAAYQSAKQNVYAGRAALTRVEQQTMLNAITAYMDVVQAQSILDLARNNERVLNEQLDAARDRFEVGEVTRTDVAQSEARLSDASAEVIAAEGDLISAVAIYERVIGHKPEGILTAPKRLPELPATLSEALQQAKAGNPDLLESRRSAKATKYDVRRNIGQLLPEVSLVGSMLEQDGAGAFGQSLFEQDSVTVNVNIPLYQSGAEYSRVRAAKAVRRQARELETETLLEVEQLVTQAWEDLETAIATIRAREVQINAAEVALEGVRQEQQYGARTVLDVLDAEQELFVARTNLVRAERDRTVAVFALIRQLGSLDPVTLALDTQAYDPEEHYNDIKWQPIGF
jgi:outer membrane protein